MLSRGARLYGLRCDATAPTSARSSVHATIYSGSLCVACGAAVRANACRYEYVETMTDAYPHVDSISPALFVPPVCATVKILRASTVQQMHQVSISAFNIANVSGRCADI